MMKGRVIANVRGWFSGRHRVWLLTIPGVAALVLLLMAVVPFLLDANAFRPLIERQISASLHRPVQLGNLSFSLFTASLVADNVVIGDDPLQGATPFLQAKALHIGVEAWPLLLHREIVITRFAADQPRIHLVHLQNGTWNFSSLSQSLLGATSNRNGTGGSRAGISTSAPAPPTLASARLQIRNGTVTLEGVPGTERPLVCQNVELTARHVSAAGQFPFEVSASLPAGGTFSAEGTTGPLAPADIANTPFNATLKVSSFNPVAAGVIEPGKGIAFITDIAARAMSDGRTLRSTGTFRASHLQLAKNGSPSAEPVDAAFDIAAPLAHSNSPNGTEVQIRDLAIKTGRSAAHVNGTVTLLPAQALLHARLSVERLPIDELQTLLPAVGVRLPRGARLEGGTVTANLAITGPASAAEFSGPIDVENTNLSGFNLGSKLNGLATLSGIVSGDSTAIQSLRTNVVVGPNGVNAQNLYAALPSLGTASGAGTISSDGALDFHLLVKLSSRAGGSGSAFGIVSTLGGLLGRTAASPLADGIPFTISGTQEDPRIRVSLPLVGTAANAEHDSSKGLRHLGGGQLMQGLLGR